MNLPEPAGMSSAVRQWYLRQEWLLVFISFALIASIRAPIPGVNEPHYFTKARHFWDPSWCARDPFLQSANAHYVFYSTFGLLTRIFSFDATALVGRILGWGLLASGWCAVSSRISKHRGFGLWSAWIFLGLATIGNWSGEWVVGGIEAKIISYACAWWSLASLYGQPGNASFPRGQNAANQFFASLCTSNSVRAAAWAGVAVSFHPVVGIWHTGALLLAAITMQRFSNCLKQFHSLITSAVVWMLLAAPGLIPALVMIRDAKPEQAYAADFIQVFHRLNHHLDPFKFRVESYVFYGAMIVFILVGHLLRWMSIANALDSRQRLLPAKELRATHWSSEASISTENGSTSEIEQRGTRQSDAETLLFRYVMIAVGVALAGLVLRASPKIAAWLLSLNALPGFQNHLTAVVKYENHLAKWLKFYPFRLADVMVPMAFAMQSAKWLDSMFACKASGEKPVWDRQSRPLIAWFLLGGICAGTIFGSVLGARNDSRLNPELFGDWQAACHWLRRETPADALCFVPAQGFGLKWYAERAEFVSQKDCPQDAAGIVAWNDRFRSIAKWSNQQSGEGYSKAMLRELHEITGIDYVITPVIGSKLAPFPIEPIYQNQSYRIYRLDDAL